MGLWRCKEFESKRSSTCTGHHSSAGVGLSSISSGYLGRVLSISSCLPISFCLSCEPRSDYSPRKETYAHSTASAAQ